MKLDPCAPGKLRIQIPPKCTIKGTPETDFEKLENSLGDDWVHVTGKRFGTITNTAAAQVLSLDALGNGALERAPAGQLIYSKCALAELRRSAVNLIAWPESGVFQGNVGRGNT
jgi:hypothetical protein